jgi:hypothetical protein
MSGASLSQIEKQAGDTVGWRTGNYHGGLQLFIAPKILLRQQSRKVTSVTLRCSPFPP